MTTTTQTPGTKDALARELRAWWDAEGSDWDDQVDGTHLPGGGDLWDTMPEVDSKAVARSSPIFEKHLGIPLDVKKIRPGGYSSIEEMIGDLVPKMRAAANEAKAKGAKK